MVEEYISRKDAEDAVRACCLEASACNLQCIKDIHAADVQPRWIHVSERLPELHDAEYLDEITGILIRYKESAPILIWLEKGGFMDIGLYEKSDAVDDFCYQGIPASVTYWMPLPEPPKEE